MDSVESLGGVSSRSLSKSISGSRGKHEIAQRAFSQNLAGKAVMEVALSCKNLPKMDMFGLSDPFIVMYIRKATDQRATKLGQTETIWYCLDPSFVKVFDIPLDTPRDSRITCEVYDRDGPTDQLSRHDYIGTVRIKMEDLLKAKGGKLELPVGNDDLKKTFKVKPELTFHLTGLRIPERPTRWEMQIGLGAGAKPPKKGTRWYFELARSDEESVSGKQVAFPHVLYRSDAVGAEVAYTFGAITLPVERIQINGRDRTLRFDLFEYKKKGGHVPLAFFEIPMSHMLGMSPDTKKDLKSRKGNTIGSYICLKSLRGEDNSGKFFHTTLQIDSLNLD